MDISGRCFVPSQLLLCNATELHFPVVIRRPISHAGTPFVFQKTDVS